MEYGPTDGGLCRWPDKDCMLSTAMVFVVGTRKLRLEGIDAPELNQICKDVQNAEWPCGRAAWAALEKLLLEPGLSCVAEAQDRYSVGCRLSLQRYA